MKNFFIDQVNVIIDNDKIEVVTINGSGAYDPNRVKHKAIELIKSSFPDSQKITAVILSHENVTFEEYKSRIGENPPWLGTIA